MDERKSASAVKKAAMSLSPASDMTVSVLSRYSVLGSSFLVRVSVFHFYTMIPS